jgi:hypothetical protein
MFMRFAIPQGTEFQLVEFLDDLKQLRLIDEYTMPNTSAETVYTNPDLSHYDPASDTWGVDIKTWTNSLDKHVDDLQPFQSSHLANLDFTDLKMIHSLTIDARRPQKILAKELRIAEYDISRRLKYVGDNRIVPSYDVLLGRKLSRVGPLALFHALSNVQTTRAVVAGIRKLPFQSWLSPTTDGFLLFIGLPTPLFTEVGTAILQRSKRVDISWVDYDTSMRYYFDETPYDEQTGQWRTDRGFAIEEPVSALKKSLVR